MIEQSLVPHILSKIQFQSMWFLISLIIVLMIGVPIILINSKKSADKIMENISDTVEKHISKKESSSKANSEEKSSATEDMCTNSSALMLCSARSEPKVRTRLEHSRLSAGLVACGNDEIAYEVARKGIKNIVY